MNSNKRIAQRLGAIRKIIACKRMRPAPASLWGVALALLGLAPLVVGQGPVQSASTVPWMAVETPLTTPVLVTGNTIIAVNPPDNRIEFFTRTGPGNYLPSGVVLTGLEPCSLAIDPNNPSRLFVANYLSDSVTVVNINARRIEALIQVGDEPTDVLVVDGSLFVTCTRAQSLPNPSAAVARTYDEQAVAIFDASPPFARLMNVGVEAHKPRALVANLAGDGVLVIPQNSGNGTTILSAAEMDALNANQFTLSLAGVVNDPSFTVNPLTPAIDAVTLNYERGWKTPLTGRILFDFERNALIPAINMNPGAFMAGHVVTPLTLADRDVVDISPAAGAFTTSTLATAVMTTQFDLARQPNSNNVWVVGQDADNRKRFENLLNGQAITNLISIVDGVSGAVTQRVLDSSIAVPSPAPAVGLLAGSTSGNHAQPVAIEFHSGAAGDRAFVACLGTGTVVSLDVGSVLAGSSSGAATVDVPLPMGLTVDAGNDLLYVYSREDLSLHVFNIVTGLPTFVTKIDLTYNPEPMSVRRGRRHLYDARLSSNHGNDTMSCASCHIFGDHDQLAWDLGNPLGVVEVLRAGRAGGTSSVMDALAAPANHPMKGPMVTQSLRGLRDTAPFHWRGDRPFFHMFRGAFGGLLGGNKTTEDEPTITDREMQEFVGYLGDHRHHPNPYEAQDRVTALIADSPGVTGDPGFTIFEGEDYLPGFRCSTCHVADRAAGNFSGAEARQRFDFDPQFFKPVQLRGIYEKNFKDLTGFGMSHDGKFDGTRGFLDASIPLGFIFAGHNSGERDKVAKTLDEWDTGVAPMVGAQIFVDSTNAANAAVVATLDDFEQSAIAGDIDLVAKGWIQTGFVPFGMVFAPALSIYEWEDDLSITLSRAQLLSFVANPANNAGFLFVCAPPGHGERMALDRDEDAVHDRVEIQIGINPSHPDTDMDGYDDGLELLGSPASQPGNGGNIPMDTTPPMVTNAASVVETWITSATVRVELSEPGIVTAVPMPVGGAPLPSVASTLPARVHDIVLTGLPAGTVVNVVLTAVDTAGNSGTRSVTVTTEIPHYHVRDVLLTSTGSSTTAPLPALTGRILLVDQDGVPVPNGTNVGYVLMQSGAANVVGSGVTTNGELSAAFTPAPGSSWVRLCVLSVGSSVASAPDYVGVLDTAAAAIFYEAAANVKNYVSFP